MTSALIGALVDRLDAEMCAAKAGPDDLTDAAARLHARLDRLLAPIVATIGERLADGGVPADDVRARMLVGDLEQIRVDVVELLTVEMADVAAAAIVRVDTMIEAAAKAEPSMSLLARLPDALRPFGMERALFATMDRLGGRLVDRFRDRTVEVLTAAARDQIGATAVRDVIAGLLDAELSQLSRHVVGDVRSEVTEAVEVARGVRWHQWVTAGDELVRDAHAQVDGEIVEVGRRFSNGWRRPGGIGCRCELHPIIARAAA